MVTPFFQKSICFFIIFIHFSFLRYYCNILYTLHWIKKKAPAILYWITRAIFIRPYSALCWSWSSTGPGNIIVYPSRLRIKARLYPAAVATFNKSSALNESRLYLLLIAWAVIPKAAAASVRFNYSVASKLLIVGAIMFTPSFCAFLHYIIKSASKQLKNIKFFRFWVLTIILKLIII